MQTYSMMEGGEGISENLKLERITHYVEHPVPIEPPIEEAPAAPMPLMLTTKVELPAKRTRRIARVGCAASVPLPPAVEASADGSWAVGLALTGPSALSLFGGSGIMKPQ